MWCNTGLRRRAGRRGMTLPELLTVLAIVSLTLLIVVPTFGRFTATNRLKSGARALGATLREARRMAIAERDNYAVVIDCNAMSSAGADADPVTRYWIARLDDTFDPATDETDIAHSGGPAPFDGEFTTLEQVSEPAELPANIVVVFVQIESTGYQGDDFGTFRLNAMRTEDLDFDGFETAEDHGVNGVDDGNGLTATDPVDPGEDDGDIDSVYRIIRFGPQGNADRATILLWDVTDGGAPLPGTIAANAPPSLRALGLPPGMTIQDRNDQRNYFTVSDQTKDTHYYTIEVTPITGQATIYDYARGTGPLPTDPGPPPPPYDWDRDKDGES